MQNRTVQIPRRNPIYDEIDEALRNDAEDLKTEMKHRKMDETLCGLLNNEIAGEFHVTILKDFLTRKGKIVGNRILRVRYFRLEISKRNSRKAKCSFRYSWIIKCGRTNGAFFFKTGPECPLGQGIICCNSTESKEIYDLIHTVCSELSRLVTPETIDQFNGIPLPMLSLLSSIDLPAHMQIDNIMTDKRRPVRELPPLPSIPAEEAFRQSFGEHHLQNDMTYELPAHDCTQKTGTSDLSYHTWSLSDSTYAMCDTPSIASTDEVKLKTTSIANCYTEDDSSEEETVLKIVVDNISESPRSTPPPSTNEQEHSQSETILKQEIERYKPMIEQKIIANEIIPYLTNLEDKDAILALQKSSPRKAVSVMLKQITASNGIGKWREFVDALKSTGYSFVANILEGKSNEAMEQDRSGQEKLLQTFTPLIIDNLRPLVLVDHLYAEEVISQNDKEEIECEEKTKGPTAASRMLLDRIPRKHCKFLPGFVTALRATGHDDEADIIDDSTANYYSGKEQHEHAFDDEVMNKRNRDVDETNEDSDEAYEYVDETSAGTRYRRYLTPDYQSSSSQECDLEQERSRRPLPALPSSDVPPLVPRRPSRTAGKSIRSTQARKRENKRQSKSHRFCQQDVNVNVRLQVQDNRNGQEVSSDKNVITLVTSEASTRLKETLESTNSQENVSTRNFTVENQQHSVEPSLQITNGTPRASGAGSFASNFQNANELSEQCVQLDVPKPSPPPYSCVATQSVPYQNSERNWTQTNQPLHFACTTNLVLPMVHPHPYNTFSDHAQVNGLVPLNFFNHVGPELVNPRPHVYLQHTAVPQANAISSLRAPPAVNQPVLLQQTPNAQMFNRNILEPGFASTGYVPTGRTNIYPTFPVQQTPTAHMFARSSRSDSGFGSGGINFYIPNHY